MSPWMRFDGDGGIRMLSGSIGPGSSRLLMRAMKSNISFWLFMPTVSMLRANSRVSMVSTANADSAAAWGGPLGGIAGIAFREFRDNRARQHPQGA